MKRIEEPQKDGVDVAIIGAGPYGLSIAAHLRQLGVNYRIFGSPMSTWLTQMPRGMHLKSEGFASSLSDPNSTFPLSAFCKDAGLPYADLGLPVPLETFTAYGLEFQKRFVPNLENKQVVSVRRSPHGFEVRLEQDELLDARRVIMAVGISHFGYIPSVLAALPEEFVTHSSRHHPPRELSGQARRNRRRRSIGPRFGCLNSPGRRLGTTHRSQAHHWFSSSAHRQASHPR